MQKAGFSMHDFGDAAEVGVLAATQMRRMLLVIAYDDLEVERERNLKL